MSAIKNRLFLNQNIVIDAQNVRLCGPFSASPMKQGSHRLVKYLNIQDCLAKSLKMKFALKVFEKHAKALKSLWILPFTGVFNTVFGDLNQYKIVAPQFYTYLLRLISIVMQSIIP